MTFWEHLDELRGTLWRSLAVTVAATIVAFCFKEQLFEAVLAPGKDSFVTYRLLDGITGAMPSFSVSLITTALAGQFMTHVKTAFCAGILVASPYVIYQLFAFISPALYARERRAALAAVIPGYAMFILGVAVSYFLIFPLTFRFLGTYQVSGEVTNMISLESYISTLIMLSLAMGAVFELPVVAVALAKAGILGPEPMRRYRRHAVVAILVIAAIITPTSDIFTLLAVSAPIYLLYEVSVLLVAATCRNKILQNGIN